MTKTLTLTITALLATLALAVAPSSASAKVDVRVGIGDQQVSTFDQPGSRREVQARPLLRAVERHAGQGPARLGDRLRQARAPGPHPGPAPHLERRPAHQAGEAAVRRPVPPQIKKIVSTFRPLGVRDFGTWNEVNHASQPTYKSPTRAADFFVEAYRAIKPRCSFCNIVALDVLDQTGVERYMRSFYRHLSSTYRQRASLVGIHNYGDVNRQRTTFTRASSASRTQFNKKTRFWFTETGGLVKFGRSFPCSEERARNRLRHVLARPHVQHERRRAPVRLQLDRAAERVRRALRRGPRQLRRHAAPGLQLPQGRAAELPAVTCASVGRGGRPRRGARRGPGRARTA